MPAEPIALAIVAALPQEVRPFLRLAKARRLAGLEFPAWQFEAGEGRGLLGVAGMGELAVLRLAAALLERFAPRGLVSAGFAGALGADLKVGDLVLAESILHYQPETGVLIGVPDPPPFLPLETLLAHLRAAGLPAFQGTFIAPAGIISKGEHAPAVAHLPHPVLELESAPLARLAAARGLPFLALRAITDAATEEIPAFIARAVSRSTPPGLLDAARWLLQDPRRLAVLLSLWRASTIAGRRLARGLQVVGVQCS
jgi:adenosylhomocysteine nucleosidase